MQDGETTAVSVAAALKASKVVNCSFRMLQLAAVGGYKPPPGYPVVCLFKAEPAQRGIKSHTIPVAGGGHRVAASWRQQAQAAWGLGTQKHRWRQAQGSGRAPAVQGGRAGGEVSLAWPHGPSSAVGREWGCVRARGQAHL